MSHSAENRIGQKVRQFRVKTDLSQEQVAKKLGLNRVSYTQLENGSRKITAEEIIELSKLFHTTPDVLLGVRKETEIEVHLEEKSKLRKKEPEMRINVPQKRVEKFREVLLYVLNKIGFQTNVGETVLNKLLYFIDFDYYEKYEEQLMGATYIKNIHGPTAVELAKIVADMEQKKEIKKETVPYHDFTQKKYFPLREPNLALLNGQELKHIDDVLARLGNMGAREISDYSHRDVPWMTTPEGEPINYEAAFYRVPPYSARNYSGENI